MNGAPAGGGLGARAPAWEMSCIGAARIMITTPCADRPGDGPVLRWSRFCCAATLLLSLAGFGARANAAPAPLDVKILYVAERVEHAPTLSNLDPIPADEGFAGARVAIDDNNTTGSFLGQSYTLEHVELEAGGAPDAALDAVFTHGTDLILADASDALLLRLADRPQAASTLIFDVRSESDDLRGADCRANVLHTMPSYAMRADALAQFMVFKRWTKWAMIEGQRPADKKFAEALIASARKFGIKIVGQKPWLETADIRRSAASELPLFTQDFPDHDVLVVADETDDFGRYVFGNTWLPRPVAGSEGITPVAWSPAVESWGAAQLQARFAKSAGRPMRPVDFAGWLAVRTIGEAVTRTSKASVSDIRSYVLSDAFELAAFKGRKQSFRDWNGEMRQPIPIVQPRAVIATAPMPGFLHQFSELDTLGQDRPESKCMKFKVGGP